MIDGNELFPPFFPAINCLACFVWSLRDGGGDSLILEGLHPSLGYTAPSGLGRCFDTAGLREALGSSRSSAPKGCIIPTQGAALCHGAAMTPLSGKLWMCTA